MLHKEHTLFCKKGLFLPENVIKYYHKIFVVGFDMSILSLAVCDDNKIFADSMTERIDNFLSAENENYEIRTFYDGLELVQHCKKNSTDILILDIDMPVMGGFEAVEELKKIQNDIKFIFVTSNDELAYQAFDYQPFWFVSKSDLEKLDGIMQKLIHKIKAEQAKANIIKLEFNNIVDINIDEAMYFDSRHNYITAHNADGSVTEFRGTITEAYNQLMPHYFVLVQRGLIVNCRFIKKLLSKTVVLTDGTEFALTRDAARQKEARDIYGKYMRE